MLNILKKFWRPRERRKHGRISAGATVKFRIIDGRNPNISSRMLQGKVLDISAEGLCIGTNTVQIDGLHIFYSTSQHKNRVEIEVELHPDLAPLRTIGEVRWYSRVEDETGPMYRMGVNWESLSQNDRQTLKNFLKGNGLILGNLK
jgi:hypothetical protein